MLHLALLATLTANAFAPTDAPAGGLGISPHRIRTTTVGRQLDLAKQPAWEEFSTTEGAGWRARFDEQTGTPHRMWGALDLGPIPDGAAAEAALRDLIARWPSLFGTDGHDLVTRNVAYVAARDTWFVDLDRVVSGAPIWNGGVTARFERGRLVLVGVDTYPDVPAPDAGVVTRADAITIVRQWEEIAGATVGIRGVTPYAVPMADGHALRLVWQVDLRAEAPGQMPGEWHVMVDRTDGSLFAAWNDVRPVEGSLSADMRARHAASPIVRRPLPLALVSSSDGSTYTDATGAFATSGTNTSLRATLEGQYVRMRNDAGSAASLAFAGGDTVWTTANATQAELSSYAFLHDVRAWGQIYGPDRDWVARRITTHVNLNDVCNAYFDPGSNSVNFYKAGSGCNNTGEIADVNYHEWGHGFHWSSIVSGTFSDTISEGVADTVAGFLTHDPVVAPYFLTTGDAIREFDSDRVYPDDFVNDPYYIHDNGLIFAGAFWDLTNLLIDDLGEDAGRAVASTLFAEALRAGPDIETAYDEVVLADDDNGDLSDGTPHQCAIINAFGRHGLGAAGATGALQAIDFDPPLTMAAGKDHTFPVKVIDLAPGCTDFTVTGGEVVWRADGGAWQRSAFAASGTDVTAVIPQQPEGSFIEYYVVVKGSSGAEVSGPRHGEFNPLSFYVGEVIELACFDFEADDGGFTHELLAGDDREGADDWMWGEPLGVSADPSAAYSGTSVWGNDLGGGRYNGDYQPDIINRLYSPVIDTTDYTGVFLGYRRWLNVEDGFYDQARIYADDAEVWQNHAGPRNPGNQHHQDQQWAPHAVPLDGQADDGAVQVSWEIQSDRGLSMAGWTIDDVCVLAPATPENKLRISDFSASDGGEQVVLTWTQPRHAPITRVIVVRNPDAFPTGPTGGEIIVDQANVTPLTPVEVVDETAPGGVDLYYGVFAYDGERWLETAVEGRNADKGSRIADPEEAIGSCGCTAGGAAAWGPVGALAALVALRRRRR